MKCLSRSAKPLIPSLFHWSFVICFIASTLSCWHVVDASSNVSTTLILNLTLCELNITEYASAFPYAVEAFVLVPAITHLISFGFMTTAHLLDAASLGGVAVSGFTKGLYILPSIYGVFAAMAFIFFMSRAVRNCMAWRYACTRYTNFIIDTKGFLHRHKGSVLIQENGRVQTGDGPVELKTVIMDGQKARHLKTVPAERWEP